LGESLSSWLGPYLHECNSTWTYSNCRPIRLCYPKSLLGRNSPGYPANPIYTFGGGTDTLRWGQSNPTFNLNPYFAQTDVKFNVLGEVYDTLFRSNPAQPTGVICWMCDNYEQSVDTNGNTHLLVQLRQNLRWQDGTTIDSKDVKFSLLTLRDLSYQFSSPLVQDVNIVTGTTFDIVMQGQSISNLVILASTPIIPRHIWEKPGDAAFDDVRTVDPAKLDLNYDPITAGTFIGSGQFVCTSLFQIDLGRVGTGCSVTETATVLAKFSSTERSLSSDTI